jgi:hypothetical protein
MFSNYGKRQLGLMIQSIDSYLEGKKSLSETTQMLWHLFEAIEESEKPIEFIDKFHDSWDALEEIVAVNGESDYRDKIVSKYFPEMRMLIDSFLN